MDIIKKIESEQLKQDIVDFNVGDTVKVHTRVVEGGKERIQIFAGIVLAKRGSGVNASFTVRKISYGEGVERVFPLYSPVIADIEVVRRGDVRRAKLYYLRALRGKRARIFEKTDGFSAKLAAEERQAALAAKQASRGGKRAKKSKNEAPAAETTAPKSGGKNKKK